MKMRNKTLRGFTLIELLVVISIVGLLASIVFVSLNSARGKARIAAGLQFSSSVHHALGAYAVGIWDFDEGSGTTANDTSGYGNNGTLTNGPVWRCASTDKSYTPSGDGCSLEFDGSNDWVQIASSSVFNIKGEITIEFWAKGAINELAVSGGTAYGVFVGNNIGYWYWGATTGGWRSYGTATGLFSSDKWTHIALTNIPGNVPEYPMPKIYINGKEVAVTGPVQEVNAGGAGSVTIGEYNVYRPYNPAEGFIDNVRIYDQALSSAQIRQLYVEGAESLGLDLAEQK